MEYLPAWSARRRSILPTAPEVRPPWVAP